MPNDQALQALLGHLRNSSSTALAERITDLFAWLDRLDTLVLWDCVERLLQIASTDTSRFTSFVHQEEASPIYADIVAQCAKWRNDRIHDVPFGTRSDPVLGTPELQELVSYMRHLVAIAYEHGKAAGIQVAAYAVAGVIDRRYKNSLFTPVRNRYDAVPGNGPDRCRIRANQLIPLRRDPGLSELTHNPFHGRTPTRDTSAGTDPRSLCFCMLAPDFCGQNNIEVCMSVSQFQELDLALRPRHRIRFGVAVLNWADEWLFPTRTLSGGQFFVGVRPDVADLRHRVQRIISLAVTKSVDVLMFPELCVSPKEQEYLVRWFKSVENETNIRMLVAGSAHWINEGGDSSAVKQSNRIQAVIGGAHLYPMRARFARTILSTLQHDKFEAFRFKRKDQSGESVETKELLRPTARRITYSVGAQQSVVLMCCKDFLDKNTMAVLEQLQPTFVFVPSLSVKNDRFQDHAGHLANRGQSRVLWGNALLAWNADGSLRYNRAEHDQRIAMIAVPDAKNVIPRSCQFDPKKHKVPALLVMSDRPNARANWYS